MIPTAITPIPPVESVIAESTDPGEVLAKMLENRILKPVPDEVIATHKAAEKIDRIRALRAEAGCPDRASRFLRDHPVDWNVKSYAVAKAWAIVVEKLTQVGGATLLLYGPQGTGKTVLGVAAVRHATAELRRCRFLTAVTLLADLSDAKIGGRLAAELRHWTGVDVLVIDQFDKLAGADWELRQVYDVIDARHNAEHVTILIANGDDTAMKAMLGPSLMQRIQEAGAFLQCAWERFRPRN